MTNQNGTYRKPRKGKESDDKAPKPISMVGAGRGGSLIAFSQGMGAVSGK